MGRAITAAASGGARKNARAALVVASLVLMLAGGLFSYLVAERDVEVVRSEATSETGQTSGSSRVCERNMTVVLDAQEEFMVTNGRYASDATELLDSRSELELSCPMSDKPYEMTIQGDVIRLVCPSHGLSQIR